MTARRQAAAVSPTLMEIRPVPIGDVIPYERNPRKNDGKAVSMVAASLREYGWKQPIVVDAEMVVIAGHTRLLAARQLGMAEVPVVIAGDLTDAQVKAYRLADNRTGEEAGWDKGLLALEVADLRELKFGLELTGFDAKELSRLRVDEMDPDATPKQRKLADTLIFQVVADCADEADQAALLERLKGEGRKCRPLMV